MTYTAMMEYFKNQLQMTEQEVKSFGCNEEVIILSVALLYWYD